MRTAIGGCAGLALVLGLSTPLVSQGSADWPQFRGPNRNGVAAAFSAPEAWPNN